MRACQHQKCRHEPFQIVERLDITIASRRDRREREVERDAVPVVFQSLGSAREAPRPSD